MDGSDGNRNRGNTVKTGVYSLHGDYWFRGQMYQKSDVQQRVSQVCKGEDITFTDAEKLYGTADLKHLTNGAEVIRKHFHGNNFSTCSIINARSGNCSENCSFCAQSSRYNTSIEKYDLIDLADVIEQGRDNDKNGIHRFSLVTAGRQVSHSDLEYFGNMYGELLTETKLQLCASMGMLTLRKAQLLQSFGVSRYHCNLETSKSYFPEICTTHTWEEKVTTIRFAQEAGMQICSGGIIGLGESIKQRIELAFELKTLGVLSIPLNILTPIKATPLEKKERVSLEELLRTIAIFRFINPRAVIRLAGGRNQFGSDQYLSLSAGANGAIVGNYLTTVGNDLKEDLKKLMHWDLVWKNVWDDPTECMDSLEIWRKS